MLGQNVLPWWEKAGPSYPPSDSHQMSASWKDVPPSNLARTLQELTDMEAFLGLGPEWYMSMSATAIHVNIFSHRGLLAVVCYF